MQDKVEFCSTVDPKKYNCRKSQGVVRALTVVRSFGRSGCQDNMESSRQESGRPDFIFSSPSFSNSRMLPDGNDRYHCKILTQIRILAVRESVR